MTLYRVKIEYDLGKLPCNTNFALGVTSEREVFVEPLMGEGATALRARIEAGLMGRAQIVKFEPIDVVSGEDACAGVMHLLDMEQRAFMARHPDFVPAGLEEALGVSLADNTGETA